LKITIAKWLTPNGNLIADVGLEPDVKVEMTEEDYKNYISNKPHKLTGIELTIEL
ncbi:hypothetical protein LCGC14_1346970, partial [marine sediment metagenome]